MFSDAQMEKPRQMYNAFYHEENMAVNGDVYGGMANRTSLLICDLDRALRNAPDAMEQFIANLFKDVLPDFDPADTLSILANPSGEWFGIKAQITERVRHFLSTDLGQSSQHLENPQHLAGSQCQRLKSLAPNDKILVWNDGVSPLPSLVRSRESSPTSNESDRSHPAVAKVPSAWSDFDDASGVAGTKDDGVSGTESEDDDDDDRYAGIISFQRKK